MTDKEQLDKWIAGESIHNKSNDMCCPDFSCCIPELLAPTADRELFRTAYVNGDADLIDRLLTTFLAKLVSNPTFERKAGLRKPEGVFKHV